MFEVDGRSAILLYLQEREGLVSISASLDGAGVEPCSLRGSKLRAASRREVRTTPTQLVK
ncbi:hypothetical protein IQ229_22660 [Nostoc cf. edaphicum LEGE 07299]|uniref:Uncharacterized protein n=1 Tax=Nostoc cf. edaphicum LEGE 07299 TaxID=2777974 RepID=A0ABR9U4T3_9NOSO|nr:hypothetical protein [Nostoc edaphicum]MBE9107628.1 hypothetical protein [Nostoc cf. edaphicum LEGE 07299]